MSEAYERRKLLDELPYSYRSLSIRSYCNKRSELYYEALRTGSKLAWLKYEDLTAKFVRIHGPKKRGI
jgi:hypothetical protein